MDTNEQQSRRLGATSNNLNWTISELNRYTAAEDNPDRKRQAAAVLTALKAAQASLRELWLAYDDVPY